MKKRISNKNLSLTIYIVAICSIIIGYAAISNRNLIINGNASITGITSSEDFNVIFLSNIETTKSADYININTPAPSNRSATFSVTNMRGYGDKVTIKYRIKNLSEYHSANFSVTLSNTNPTYFLVTKSLGVQNLNHENIALNPGEETELTITGNVIKIPTNNAEISTVTVTISAQSTPYEGGVS